MQIRKHFDQLGRVLSLLIFIAGVGLLILVFVVAYHMLTNPVPGLSAALAQAGAKGNSQQPLVGISSAVIAFLLRLAVLFVMTIAASLIAARGIHLYFAAIGSGHAQDAAIVPPDTVTSSGGQASSSQSAAAPAASNGTLSSRGEPSEREGANGAITGEVASKPRQ